MKLRIYTSLGIVLFLLMIGVVGVALTRQEATEAYTSNNLIRLHVVANSNSAGDQELKLEVRDAILAATRDLFLKAREGKEARTIVLGNLEYITEVAKEEIRRWDSDYDVRVEYGRFPFPERSYGTITLPAGDYNALRVVIGEGRGANWWCVLFPPLCFNEDVGGKEVIPPDEEPVSGGKLIFKLNSTENEGNDVVEKNEVQGKGIEFRFKSRSSRRLVELLATPLSYLYNLFRRE